MINTGTWEIDTDLETVSPQNFLGRWTLPIWTPIVIIKSDGPVIDFLAAKKELTTMKRQGLMARLG